MPPLVLAMSEAAVLFELRFAFTTRRAGTTLSAPGSTALSVVIGIGG